MPRTHTREAVLDEIFEWIVGNVGRETWIAWLNGAAGAGKSAICQSIAERCILHGILVASFFFFRTDNSRNTVDPLVATLAYQLIQLLPETKKPIVEVVESNPLIFKQSFEAQLNLLVVQPLRQLQMRDPHLGVSIHRRWSGRVRWRRHADGPHTHHSKTLAYQRPTYDFPLW